MTITKVHRQTITVTTATTIVRCPFCEREVETLSTAEAGALLVTAGRRLDAGVASGQVHVIQTVSGSPRVCKDSLFAV